jgi:hypothetical protein
MQLFKQHSLKIIISLNHQNFIKQLNISFITMGACEVSTNEYYVFLDEDSASEFVSKVDEYVFNKVKEKLREKDEKFEEYLDEIHDIFLNELYYRKLDIGSMIERGYYTGLVYLPTDMVSTFYAFYDILEESIEDFFYDDGNFDEELENREELIELFEKTFENLVIEDDIIKNFLKNNKGYLGTVYIECHWGLWSYSIKDDNGLSEYYQPEEVEEE